MLKINKNKEQEKTFWLVLLVRLTANYFGPRPASGAKPTCDKGFPSLGAPRSVGSINYGPFLSLIKTLRLGALLGKNGGGEVRGFCPRKKDVRENVAAPPDPSRRRIENVSC